VNAAMKHLAVAGVLASLVSLAGPVAADPSAELSRLPNRNLLVHIDDDSGQLAKLVHTGHTGVVRCFDKSENLQNTEGVPVVGCFVAVTRDGHLVAPPSDKAWPRTYHTNWMGTDTLAITARSATKLELTISGMTADVLGLWVDCADGSRGDLTCHEQAFTGDKFTWDISFGVGTDGVVTRL
jgi:hypothetical protein